MKKIHADKVPQWNMMEYARQSNEVLNENNNEKNELK